MSWRQQFLMLRLALYFAMAFAASSIQANERPNILWITCEDISPNIRCYGDSYAVTPNIDRLAEQGVRYTHAFAPIGVCAPSRSCLITGMYACSIGTQHMRCQGELPEYVKCFPEYLRQVGYYCTNNVKTDYNFRAGKQAWDESSNRAHWRNRPEGKPFFSVFNFTSCHESQIRLPEAQYQKRTEDFTELERHDPDEAPIPPYHPDTPAVRRDWARYADMITYMDGEVGRVLKELEEDGLSDETIVFYFSDHGAGMPRSKRWLYDSSVRVPFIVRFPEKYGDIAPGAAGTTTDRLVSFVDFAPTVLSLADTEVPGHMQGVPFLGKQAGEPREYVHGYRDRMDERYDMLRMTRDHRFKYIRNYMPHLPYFHHQHISYMYEMPTMRDWQRLADEGELEGPTSVFMARSKPVEELYDTVADPWEVTNLANSAKHHEVLEKLRGECRRWQQEIVDLGLLPESDLRTRFGGEAPHQAVRDRPQLYPLSRIAAAADLGLSGTEPPLDELASLIRDKDPAARYWATVRLGGKAKLTDQHLTLLTQALKDESAAVRVAAADGLCQADQHTQAMDTLSVALSDENEWVRLQAINVVDRIDKHASGLRTHINAALQDTNEYVVRVAKHAMDGLEK